MTGCEELPAATSELASLPAAATRFYLRSSRSPLQWRRAQHVAKDAAKRILVGLSPVQGRN
jgi:hypothetical protein